jgi:hypothetical protein
LLTYQSSGFWEHPCKTVKSGIYFRQVASLSLISEYTPENFEAAYENGSVQSAFPQLAAMVHVDNGVAVMSNEGQLALIKVAKRDIHVENVARYPSQAGVVQMFYSKKRLFLIGKNVSSLALRVS